MPWVEELELVPCEHLNAVEGSVRHQGWVPGRTAREVGYPWGVPVKRVSRPASRSDASWLSTQLLVALIYLALILSAVILVVAFVLPELVSGVLHQLSLKQSDKGSNLGG